MLGFVVVVVVWAIRSDAQGRALLAASAPVLQHPQIPE